MSHYQCPAMLRLMLRISSVVKYVRVACTVLQPLILIKFALQERHMHAPISLISQKKMDAMDEFDQSSDLFLLFLRNLIAGIIFSIDPTCTVTLEKYKGG
jgi:hypothetical protein